MITDFIQKVKVELQKIATTFLQVFDKGAVMNYNIFTNEYLNMDEKILDKILIEVLDIKDQLKNTSTKDDLTKVKSEILGEVDGFIKLHQTLDIELSSLRSKYGRLEERLVIVEQKLQIA